MSDMLFLWQTFFLPGGVLIGAAGLALLVHVLVFSVGLSSLRHANQTADLLVKHTQRPARLVLPLLVALLVLPALELSPEAGALVRHLIGLGLIGSVGWLLIQLSAVGADRAVAGYQDVGKDDLLARSVRTRVNVLRRVMSVVITVFTVALMLMTFPSIQHLGISLLASAGFAGLVVGMAAQPALSNLIAGLQIALTQPIRINDVVIVEDEWGWIEEIGTTYVVVRVWDLRRLVIPLTAFIERPFQNWTRVNADLLGTVFVYADYSLPVDELREELHRVLKASPLWDGRVWGLQVTNATEHTQELRALMSAPDSGTAWDLRCEVREKLIAFIRDRYPQALPRVRAELRNGPSLPAVGQAEAVEGYQKVSSSS